MKRFLQFLPFVVLFGLPALALAQASELVPCGVPRFTSYFDPNYYVQATSCNFCYFAKLIQNIVNFLVMVTIPISVGMFAWAGILFFTNAGNPKRIARARSIFRSVLIGFIITITGWLVVQVILQSVTNQDYSKMGSYFSIDCHIYNGPNDGKSVRPRNLDISQVLTPVSAPPSGYQYPTNPNNPSGPITPAGPAVTPIDVQTVGPNGMAAPIALSTTQSDLNLIITYDEVQAKYGDQIQAACNGSSVPNCTQVVTATIAAESGGNPNAISSTGAKGLMQAMPGSPGSDCASTDTQCQINGGAGYLNTIYKQFPDIPNSLAGYNSGISTSPYPNGTKPGLAPSSDCVGLYAWQCVTNPGGLQETRGYVANICRTLTLRGTGC
ncbi:lytic transglycosylase domain-containing protein [Patescibacteria group bacterium]|nr:lytic transglycosylase domain-containing protein [Patescibacteria group bacterium]